LVAVSVSDLLSPRTLAGPATSALSTFVSTASSAPPAVVSTEFPSPFWLSSFVSSDMISSSRRILCGFGEPASSVDEVEHREQVDPNQIDQVPIEGGEVDRAEIARSELSAARDHEHPDPKADADHDVDAVQTGHE